MNHLPPCCASCGELDPQKRQCRLLARPTLEARQRLLSMPCDVPRLVRLRFRGHGEDVASQAIASWTAPAHDPNTLAWSFGDGPRDARLWLTAWPFRELARAPVQKKLGELRPLERRAWEPAPSASATDPVLLARIASALAKVAQIDAAGFAMLVESLAGEFQTSAWRDAIGAMDAAVAERRLLALYAYAVVFFDAFTTIPEDDARAALQARRFTPGDPSDADALTALRATLDRRAMTLKEMKALYTHGALGSIDGLAREGALGATMDPATRCALARALRIEDESGADLDGAAENIRGAIAWHAGTGGSFGSADHVDPDRLAALATGALDTPNVAPIARHLFVCADRRCNTLLRWEVGGREAAKRFLSGPMSSEPPRASSVPPQGTPHIVYCRDVLWQAFAKMAQAEGRSIDDLVEDAMVRYQSVREIVAPEPPKKARTSSMPAPASRSSVPPPRATRSSAPPPRSTSSAPPPPHSRTQPSVPPPPPPPRLVEVPPPPPSSMPPPNVAPNEPTPMISRVILKDLPLPSIDAPRAEMLDRAADLLEAGGPPSSEASPPAPATVPAPRPWSDQPVANAPQNPIPPNVPERTESLADESDFSEREDTSPKMNFTPLSPPLFVEYAGRRYHVASMRFVIGRERNTCHLVLPDSNVSRQHAIVEWVSGNYYLVDQGSTNGVGSGGHRIHRKQIVEGDHFDICGHQIAFSFRIQ